MSSESILGLLIFDTAREGLTSRKRRRDRRSVPLTVEPLEERTVPDATTNFVSTPTLVPVANTFSPFLTNTPVLVAGANYLALSNQPLPLLTISGVNSVGPSQELVRLFGPNAVNSTGQGPSLARSWLPDAWGYGSGTKPDEPWAPAYMSVGLANQQATPWGRTISYGQGSGARTNDGNQANPRPGGGGAVPRPGDANRPDKGKQDDAPDKNQKGEKKEQKKEEPKKADPSDKGQKKEDPKQKDQGNERPGDKPDGVPGQVLSDRLGGDADERMASIDRILLGHSRDEQDEGLSDPVVLSGSLWLSSAPADPFGSLLPIVENHATADEALGGGAVGESMDGGE